QTAGDAHLLDFFGSFQMDCHAVDYPPFPRIAEFPGLPTERPACPGLHAAPGAAYTSAALQQFYRLQNRPHRAPFDEFTPVAPIRAGVPCQYRVRPREAPGKPNPGTLRTRTATPIPAAGSPSGVLQCPRSPCVRCWKPASTSATRPATGTPR